MTQYEEDLDDAPASPRMGMVPALITLASFAAVGYYFYQQADYVGVGATVAVMLGAFVGFGLGLSRIAASIVGLGIAAYFAPSLGISQEHHFAGWFETSGLLNRAVAITSIGIVIALLSTLILGRIARRIVDKRPRLSRMNRWLGFLVGGGESLVVVLVLLGGVLVIHPLVKEAAAGNEDVKLVKFVDAAKIKTEASKLGPYVKEYNPFTKFPQLNQFQRIKVSVELLSQPGQVQSLMNHPKIDSLKENQNIRSAIDELMNDPELKQQLESSSPKDLVPLLLKSPAVLKLLDEPAFREAAAELIKTPVPNSGHGNHGAPGFPLRS